MNLDTLRELLLWCTIMNVGILLIWWIAIMVARDMIHRTHGRWFHLSSQQFDEIHYRVMAQYKMAIVIFNIVPYVALRIIG